MRARKAPVHSLHRTGRGLRLVRRVVRTLVVCALGLCTSVRAFAADKTDVVVLVNGDHLTGEIDQLQKGQLQYKTDHEGTIQVEWAKIVQITSTRLFEVVTSDGRRFLGSLGRAEPGFILIVGGGEVPALTFAEVTEITPIGASFWKKLDGSLSAGFNYTRSSGVAQTNVSTDTHYRRPGFFVELQGNATLTYQSDSSDNSRSDQGTIEFSYGRYRGRRWIVGGAAKLETNESLGLVLRSQAGAAVGYRLVNSNNAQVIFGGGLTGNNEQGVDTAATQNLEGLINFKMEYYKYSHPKTNFDFSVEWYPSLSDWGRQRLQVNSDVKRELWRDFYVSLSGYDTFDSQPPGASSSNNDIGIVISISWTYGR